MKKTKFDVVFNSIIAFLMVVLCIIFFIPFWITIISSFASNLSLQMNGYTFIPERWSFEGYLYIFSATEINFFRAIGNSLIVAFGGILISVSISTITAYALSKKQLIGIKGLNIFYMITMFFAGGTIPLFLVIKTLKLYDTLWSLLLPTAFNLYHIILIRSYFYSLPASIEEAAMIDGATDFQVLIKVFLPISVPIVLTVSFFMFVDRWNSWMDALLYLGPNSQDLWPLQFVLKNMLENMEILGASPSGVSTPTMSAKSAGVVISIAPLLFIFPIIQKYFVNGITVGAVKG